MEYSRVQEEGLTSGILAQTAGMTGCCPVPVLFLGRSIITPRGKGGQARRHHVNLSKRPDLRQRGSPAFCSRSSFKLKTAVDTAAGHHRQRMFFVTDYLLRACGDPVVIITAVAGKRRIVVHALGSRHADVDPH